MIATSLLVILVNFYLRNFIPQPKAGGRYIEGLIGAPQYINPLLCQTNDVDTDISRLIFSGLLKYDKNLNLVSDLAASWQISEDKKIYTVMLKPGLQWEDGEPMTADDIVFSVRSIQDPDFKSPWLISFRGVEVEKVDNLTVKFILSEPFNAFLEVLTFGILPEHIWGGIPPINANLTEYNLKPIGSGRWKFKTLTKDKLGNIKSYTLEPNPLYHGAKPYIQEITFKFYPDFQTAISALQNNSVEGISFLPKELKKDISSVKDVKQYSFELPQYTAAFFNQKQNDLLKEHDIRKALAMAIDKEKILSQALQFEGQIIDGPILPESINNIAEDNTIKFNLAAANELLEKAGWVKISIQEYQNFLKTQEEKKLQQQNQTGSSATTTAVELQQQSTTTPKITQTFFRQKGEQILEITLTTVNQPENTKAAELIQQFWENIGFKVNLQIVEPGKMRREIIKPRNYQALLFGIIVGSDADPYPFWHSSQVQDPGLNLSAFANRKADTLMEDARKSTKDEEKKKYYEEFQNILLADIPAVFLYNPTYTYLVSQKVKNIKVKRITIPADRFNDIESWYIKTKRVFQNKDLKFLFSNK